MIENYKGWDITLTWDDEYSFGYNSSINYTFNRKEKWKPRTARPSPAQPSQPSQASPAQPAQPSPASPAKPGQPGQDTRTEFVG